MHRSLPSFLLATILLGTPGPGQTTQDRAIAEIDRLCTAHVEAAKIPGLSVGIVKDGKLVFAKGYGQRDLAGAKPVTTDTRFAAGSVTKQFTCACVFLLAEAGKLSIHDKVAKHRPELAHAGDITLLDLMNHTSGYPDYYPLDFVDHRMKQPITADALIERYAGKGVTMDFAPGTAYSYSNTGYIILGRIIEKVSGQPFAAFLKRNIIDRLGMTQTVFLPAAGPTIANGYTTFALGPSEPNDPEAAGWVGAAGGIFTTPTDLAKWDLALLAGKVVGDRSLSWMTRRRRLANGSLTGYGCGLAVGTRAGREILSHGGAINGFVAYNAVVPSIGAAMVLFCNQDGGLGPLPGRLLDVLLRDPRAAQPTTVPRIDGPSVEATVRTVFDMLQRGKVDRRLFTPDFSDYLDETRLTGAATRLAKLGAVGGLTVRTRGERGGMEVSVSRLELGSGPLEVLMYRHRDGKIAQFFVQR